MKKLSMVVAAAVTLLGTGCAQRVSQESAGDIEMGSAASGSAGWGGNFRGMEGYRDTRGSAYARPTETGTQIALTLESGFSGSRFAWDFREGTCGTPGQLIGDANAYPMVILGDRGMGNSVADVTVRMDAGKKYFVNLYSLAAEQRTPIACAMLSR